MHTAAHHSHAATHVDPHIPFKPVRVVRVPIWPAQDGFLPRLRMYFSFVIMAMVFGPSRCQRPDLIWVESPPLFVGIAALYLAWRWRCPYVLNVSDLWPQSAIDMGMIKQHSVSTRAAQWLEKRLYGRAAGITGQSTGIICAIEHTLKQIQARLPPMQVITNGVDPARFIRPATPFYAEAEKLLGTEPGPIFIYAGLLGHAQGIDQILDLAAALPDAVPGRFVLVGDGPMRQRIAQRLADTPITRVRLLPPQPSERIPALLAASDAAIITLGRAIHGAVPSKIYEAMAAQLPILLIATGEAAERVQRAQCGLTVQPGDHAGMLQICIQLANDAELRHRLGRAGRTAAETEYNRQHIASQLDVFLQSVLA